MSYRDAVKAAKYAGGANEQATALHERRLETVAAGAGYFDFDEPRGVVLHVVPTGVYDDGYAIDLSERGVLPEANPTRPAQLPVLGGDDARGTWTADGFGAYVASNDPDGRCAGYAHLFSNGVVESVSALPFGGSSTDVGAPRLDGRTVELATVVCVRRYLRVLSYHQATAPIHVALSVYGTEGCPLDPGDAAEPRKIREDVLAPFPVSLRNFDADVRAELADPIDALWRAAGHPGSPFFADGEWTLRSAFEESR
ncbi:hypothetical protein [Haladaptatus halobius]|uniref:hypothetical protein n=1 Tax=Haladaptatus halobius TaxID=2884875 RepID=UPI001D0B01A4|nr:hypothetical protein [Haladaptatus halobius]